MATAGRVGGMTMVMPYAIPDPRPTPARLKPPASSATGFIWRHWNRGSGRAGKIVAIDDGAEWIWNLVDRHFPGAIQIIDLFHARQRLWELARLLHPGDIQRQQQWILRHQPKLDGLAERMPLNCETSVRDCAGKQKSRHGGAGRAWNEGNSMLGVDAVGSVAFVGLEGLDRVSGLLHRARHEPAHGLFLPAHLLHNLCKTRSGLALEHGDHLGRLAAFARSCIGL
jgi:hypothetical protein